MKQVCGYIGIDLDASQVTGRLGQYQALDDPNAAHGLAIKHYVFSTMVAHRLGIHGMYSVINKVSVADCGPFGPHGADSRGSGGRRHRQGAGAADAQRRAPRVRRLRGARSFAAGSTPEGLRMNSVESGAGYIWCSPYVLWSCDTGLHMNPWSQSQLRRWWARQASHVDLC